MITDASSSPIFYQEEGGIQSVWTTTPGDTVNRELKLSTMHLVLSGLGW